MTQGRVLAFLLIVLCALIASCSSGGAKKPLLSQTTLDEVHPCDTNDPFGVQASRLNVSPSATVAPTATPTQAAGGATDTVNTVRDGNNGVAAATGQPGCDAPDFSQRCPLWGND